MRYFLLLLCFSFPLAAKEGCYGDKCNAILMWNGILTGIEVDQDGGYEIVIEEGTEPLNGKLTFAKNPNGQVYLESASQMRFHVIHRYNNKRREPFNTRVSKFTVTQPEQTKGLAFKLDINGTPYQDKNDDLKKFSNSESAVVTVKADGTTPYTASSSFRVETYIAVSIDV